MKASNKHPLILDHPADTMNRCADIIRFLMEQRTMAGIVESESAENGRHWILQCVEEALLYEKERATEPKIRSVS